MKTQCANDAGFVLTPGYHARRFDTDPVRITAPGPQSIAAAASRCIVGVTCEYRSKVIAIVECPSISDTWRATPPIPRETEAFQPFGNRRAFYTAFG